MRTTTVRYKTSVEPVHTDGRDIDPDAGELIGEAAGQKSSGSSDEHLKKEAQVWEKLPEPELGDVTYYDRPMLAEPVWEWAIPTYYYIGGLSGASLVLGAAAQLKEWPGKDQLIRRCHWIGVGGTSLSAVLLIYDLGVPWRFFNMLRVFRPTSPMNMGVWILSGASGSAMGALILSAQRGLLGAAGRACGYLSGIFGAMLATYTGVLVSNSAIPIWQQSRRVLPVLFGASAISSVGSAFEMLTGNAEGKEITRTFGMLGQLAELAAAHELKKQTSVVPRVGRPLHEGLTGAMWRTSAALTASSLVIAAIGGRSKRKRFTAGLLGTLGAALMRYTIAHMGTASARDARASFHQQRAGHGAAEVS